MGNDLNIAPNPFEEPKNLTNSDIILKFAPKR
jgi:hypothetical protein